MEFLTTGRTSVQSVKCCVLFGPSDGVIRHVHHVVTMEGADETEEAAIEKRTVELARESGVSVKGLKALLVDPAEIKSDKVYAVDPKGRRLVEVDRQTRK
jgi:protein-tyrosine-phosphatase